MITSSYSFCNRQACLKEARSPHTSQNTVPSPDDNQFHYSAIALRLKVRLGQ